MSKLQLLVSTLKTTIDDIHSDIASYTHLSTPLPLLSTHKNGWRRRKEARPVSDRPESWPVASAATLGINIWAILTGIQVHGLVGKPWYVTRTIGQTKYSIRRTILIQFPKTGSPTQKGIITYGLSNNRQRALAGTAHSAVFNTARRTRAQILYCAIPMLIGYETMQWAIER